MKATYDKIYKSLDYGPIATARGLTAAKHVMILWPPPRKVLCVGAGNAYEAVYLSENGYDVTVVDYIKAPVIRPKFKQIVGDARHLPFKENEFELVLCCECMEHLNEEDIDDFLNGLKAVTTFFYFTVDDQDDPPYHSHACIKEPTWWLDKFNSLGFTGKMYKPQKFFTRVENKIIELGYPSGRGFNIYGNKVF